MIAATGIFMNKRSKIRIKSEKVQFYIIFTYAMFPPHFTNDDQYVRNQLTHKELTRNKCETNLTAE